MILLAFLTLSFSNTKLVLSVNKESMAVMYFLLISFKRIIFLFASFGMKFGFFVELGFRRDEKDHRVYRKLLRL